MKITIIGAGEIGQYLAGMLATEKKDVTLLDRDAESLNNVSSRYDLLTVCGSATSPKSLLKAGVRDADLVIAATDVDEVNILASMMSKRLGAKKTIARVRNPEYTESDAPVTPSELGIDIIIQPEMSTANEVLQLVKRADATDVIELANGQIQLIGLKIEKDSEISGETLDSMSSELEFNFRVVAILRGGRTIIPSGTDKVVKNDTIFVIIKPENVDKLVRISGHHNREIKNVMIAGGSPVGENVMKLMSREKRDWQIKLIDSDPERSYRLASENKNVLVLQGEPDDVNLLASEGIMDTDVFISVTDDEESNIVNCLMAKHLGVRKTIALLSKSSLIPLSQTIGLDAAVNTKLSASNEIHRHVLQGKVYSVTGLHGISAELLELEVGTHCRAANKPLYKSTLPFGSIVGAIINENEVEIATGKSVLQSGDRIMVFSVPQSVEKVSGYFQ